MVRLEGTLDCRRVRLQSHCSSTYTHIDHFQTCQQYSHCHKSRISSLQRLTKRQAAPNTDCDTAKEGQVHPIPANGDFVWICRSGEWIPFE